MPSISEIFAEITSAVTSFTQTLSGAFNGITSLFYTAGQGSDPGQFTFLGVLVLIGCGVGLVYLVYRIIKGLMHRA